MDPKALVTASPSYTRSAVPRPLVARARLMPGISGGESVAIFRISRKRTRVSLAAFITALLVAPTSARSAQHGAVTGQTQLATWMSNGPFGGVVTDLAVDPHDPSTVYAGTRGGVFKTVDGGETWRGVNDGLKNLSIRGIEVHPVNSNLVFAAASSGLFRSQDGGSSWSEVAHDASSHFRRTFLDIHFSDQGSTIFALGNYDILRSDDDGVTWSLVYHQEPETLESMAVSADGGRIYVGGQGGLLVSEDEGQSWRELPIPAGWVSSVALDPTDPAAVYAEAEGFLFKSNDGGSTWSRLLSDDVYAVEVELAPNNPDTVYVVGYEAYAPNRRALYVARSDDAAATWREESRMRSDALRQATLAVDPSEPHTVYIGTGGHGVFKSSDGGASFFEKAQGMTAASPFAVAIDPNDPSRIYASLTLGDSFRSEDAGETWTRIPSGPGSGDPYLTSSVTDFVVTADSTLYAAGASNDIYSTEPRVFKSESHGEDWVAADHGLPADHHVADLISAGPGVLVAGLTRHLATNEGGIYSSDDGGATWADISPTGMATRALAYDEQTETLFALVGRGGTPFQSSLYSSRDRGRSWLPHVLPPHLGDPGSISLGRTGQVLLGSSLGTEIGLSHDLGLTWVVIQVADNKSGQVNDIAQDPLDPTQLFVATGWGGIWISNTAGVTWRQMMPDVFGIDARTIVFGPKTDGIVHGLPDLDDRPLYAAVAGSDSSGVWQVFPAPHAFKSPAIKGRPRPGERVRCARGLWSRADSFRFRWLRDGSRISRANDRTYRVQRADRRHSISCRVRGRGPGGATTRASRPIKVRS